MNKSWVKKIRKPKSPHDFIPKWFLEAKKKNYTDDQLRQIIKDKLIEDYGGFKDHQIEMLLAINNGFYDA